MAVPNTASEWEIAALVLLIMVIGGRIIPSFTHNWIMRENPGRLPVPFGRFDVVVIALSAVALTHWIARPAGRSDRRRACCSRCIKSLTPSPMGARPDLARTPRIHSARWLRLHTVRIFSWSGAALEVVLPSAGIHAWTAGAAGIMTLAVITCASLGHTGNALTTSGGDLINLFGRRHRCACPRLRCARTGLELAVAPLRGVFLVRCGFWFRRLLWAIACWNSAGGKFSAIASECSDDSHLRRKA